jgi:hypothetical protein
MRSYKSEDKFKVRGKDVFAVRNDERFKKDSNHLIGEIVEIDGVQRKVIGVDAWALSEIREGAPIGLMVED